MAFEVTLRDHTVEVIEAATAYQQEGPMTTFFQHGSGRQTLDAWATRIASVRTSEVLVIRRVEVELERRVPRTLRSA
ncbi:MAG: hypothetical protein ACRD0U_09070 [Acidimicrobiales bacterium]